MGMEKIVDGQIPGGEVRGNLSIPDEVIHIH